MCPLTNILRDWMETRLGESKVFKYFKAERRFYKKKSIINRLWAESHCFDRVLLRENDGDESLQDNGVDCLGFCERNSVLHIWRKVFSALYDARKGKCVEVDWGLFWRRWPEDRASFKLISETVFSNIFFPCRKNESRMAPCGAERKLSYFVSSLFNLKTETSFLVFLLFSMSPWVLLTSKLFLLTLCVNSEGRVCRLWILWDFWYVSH